MFPDIASTFPRHLPALAAEKNLQCEKSPQGVAVVVRPDVVLGYQLVHRATDEVLLDTGVGRAEGRADVAAQVFAEPAVERHPEPALRAVQDLRRHDVGDSAAQDALQREASSLQLRREAASEVEQVGIEERRAHLE